MNWTDIQQVLVYVKSDWAHVWIELLCATFKTGQNCRQRWDLNLIFRFLLGMELFDEALRKWEQALNIRHQPHSTSSNNSLALQGATCGDVTTVTIKLLLPVCGGIASHLMMSSNILKDTMSEIQSLNLNIFSTEDHSNHSVGLRWEWLQTTWSYRWLQFVNYHKLCRFPNQICIGVHLHSGTVTELSLWKVTQ